jgi:hypothetical protein
LEVAIVTARNSGIPMDVDYEPGTAGFDLQRKVYDISFDIFMMQLSLDQEGLNRTLDLMHESQELFGKSYNGCCQRERIVDIVKTGILLKYGIPKKFKQYIPEAMLGIDQLL